MSCEGGGLRQWNLVHDSQGVAAFAVVLRRNTVPFLCTVLLKGKFAGHTAILALLEDSSNSNMQNQVSN